MFVEICLVQYCVVSNIPINLIRQQEVRTDFVMLLRGVAETLLYFQEKPFFANCIAAQVKYHQIDGRQDFLHLQGCICRN